MTRKPEPTTEKLLKQVIRHITDRYSVDAIYLFGSQASKDSHDQSDIDLGILFRDYIKDPIDRTIRTDTLKEELSHMAGGRFEFDVVDAEGAPTALQHAVIQGELLEGGDNYHTHKFENAVLSKVEMEFPNV